MDKRKNNGGARKGAGRKKGVGLSYDIQKYCNEFIIHMLENDAIRLKATKQLTLQLNKNHKAEYLYIIENKGLYKIGYSSNWNKRYKNYKTHLGVVNLVFVAKINNAFNLEEYFHNVYNKRRVSGEWFDLDERDLLEIISYCSSKII